MLSDEGVAMLGKRRHQQLYRTGTIVGLKGDNYVVHWDDNAKETVKPYARRYIKVIEISAESAPRLGEKCAVPPRADYLSLATPP